VTPIWIYGSREEEGLRCLELLVGQIAVCPEFREVFELCEDLGEPLPSGCP
jgi:hypothetical protein